MVVGGRGFSYAVSALVGAELGLRTFAADGSYASSTPFPETVARGVTAGVAMDPGSGSLYSATSNNFSGGAPSVQVFAPRAVPGVVIDPPSGITPFTAHLSGIVTPVGNVTSYHFEYSSDGGLTWSSTATEETPSGEESPVAVSADLSLEPVTKYLVRLVADDGESKNPTLPVVFSTTAAAPLAVTGAASGTGTEKAHLQGTVNPQGSQATFHFEYGTTTAYGSRVPATESVAGNGRKAVSVGRDITGLLPGTVYHYRLVANGPGGEGDGEDHSFETLATAPPQRGFELISPLDKGNVSVELSHAMASASTDGNHILYATEKATYPGAESTPLIPAVDATRTAQGWTTTFVDPPLLDDRQQQENLFATITISADHSRAFVASKVALTPGAVQGNVNLYIRNLKTNSYTLVGIQNLSEFTAFGATLISNPEFYFIGGSADLSTVVFVSEGKLTPEAVAKENMYEWQEGKGLSLVSLDPDGEPFEMKTQKAVPALKDPNQVSEDGNRIYFEVPLELPGGEFPTGSGALYLSEDGKTRLISVSRRPGDPQVPVAVDFIRASADGRFVIFTANGGNSNAPTPPLTPDAPEAPRSTYRYDAVTGELTYLASEVNIQLAAAFPSTGDLFYRAESTTGGNAQLRYEHEGVSTLIAPEQGQQIIRWAASPNGKYLAFLARGQFTSYDNHGVEEVYLYEAEADHLVCASCRSDGGAPTGEAGIGVLSADKPTNRGHFPRAMLDDGTVLFDTPDALVPSDSNGQRDVYSYRDGEVTPISRGDLTGASEFVDASASGSDIFFTSGQRLVPQDKDPIVDLYDARVGGGFPYQEPASLGRCGAGECDNGGGAKPALAISSEAVTGPAAGAKHRASPRCRKTSHKRGKASAARCAKAKKPHKRSRGSGAKNRDKATKGAGR